MKTIDIDQLINVCGGYQLAARTPSMYAPRDFVPPGLRPDQLTVPQMNADRHGRVNIKFFNGNPAQEIQRARPWVSPAQASDSTYQKGFMVPWY